MYSMKNELCHFGVLGMRWRHRKAKQTSSGVKRKTVKSLTNEELIERTQRAKLENDYKAERNRRKELTNHKQTSNTQSPRSESSKSKSSSTRKKSVHEMSDGEIRDAINRKKLENEYRSLYPEKQSAGKRFAKYVGKEVLVPAAADLGKQYAKGQMAKYMNEIFGLEGDQQVYANNKKKNK